METLCIKLEDNFAGDIEKAIKKYHYTTKTEFVREALRSKLSELEKAELLKNVQKMYCVSKHKTTDEQLHKAREKAVEELEEKFKRAHEEF